jgi:uncharacterized membrane protein HdeD (DUF308 family)
MAEATSIDSEDQDVIEAIGRSWGWVLFFGIATLVLGILVVIQPKATIYGFALLLGIWLFVSGLFRIIVAIADRHDTGGTRWLVAILGILSVIIGIFFLRHTYETVASLTFLLGLFWVIGGIIEFVSSYGRKGLPGRGFGMVMGLLAVAAGIVTLVWPSITLHVLVYIMGFWLIVYGLLQIVTSLTIRKLFAKSDGATAS